MGFWDRLLAPWRAKDGGTTAANPANWFIDWVRGGEETLAGVRVSWKNAIRQAAVWACVRVRSEDVGKLPCILYRWLDEGGKERAVDHPAYDLMRVPNPRMTGFEFKQMMQALIDLRGNAYALKEFDSRGRVVALWPVDPECPVTVLKTLDARELFYRIGTAEPIPGEALIHLRGLSLDGIVGLSPIAYHRETIGLAIAAEKYGASFFGNNAQPKGGLEVPPALGSEAVKLLRESWEQRHRGLENAHRLAIFDGGMKWVQTGMDNADAQYIETRRMQNQEIWRIYRMPPHKVGDLDKATFSNIEQQALEYVTDCLMSELVRWEQTLMRDLLTAEERKQYFFEFMVDALLRGDFKSRMEGYAIGRNWGLFSANDCRDKENMNRITNGNIYLQPLNMIEAGKLPPVAGTSPDLSPAGAKALIAQLQVMIARQEQPGAHMNGHGA